MLIHFRVYHMYPIHCARYRISNGDLQLGLELLHGKDVKALAKVLPWFGHSQHNCLKRKPELADTGIQHCQYFDPYNIAVEDCQDG